MAALLDNFTATDGTLVTAHAADSGESWTTFGGGQSPKVATNRVRGNANNTFSTALSSWAPPGGTADYYVEVPVYVASVDTCSAWIYLHYVDSSNYYRLQVQNVGTIALQKVIGGTAATLGSYSRTMTAGETFTLRAEVLNNVLTVKEGGANKIAGVAGDATLAGAGKVALGFLGAATDTTGLHFDSVTADAVAGAESGVSVTADDTGLVFSPGNWRTSATSRIAIHPGAYVRIKFTGTSLSLACTGSDGDVLAVSVDDGPWVEKVVAASAVTLASGLTDATHTAVVIVKRMSTYANRWQEGAGAKLQIDTIYTSTGGSFGTATARSKRMLAYGDSITEGFNLDAVGTNNALYSYSLLLALALDAEVGVIATGGQGWQWANANTSNVPFFADAWDLYSESHPRDFSSAPDYVLINQGTNDGLHGVSDATIQSTAEAVLADMRTAMPTTTILVLVPFGGYARVPLTAAVATRRESDPNVHLVDMGAAAAVGLPNGGVATLVSVDGLHPNAYGSARLATITAHQIEAVLRVRELGATGGITGTLNLQGGGTAAAGTMYAARVDTDAIVSQATVGADGSFALDGLVVGQEYRVWGETTQSGAAWTAQPRIVAAA